MTHDLTARGQHEVRAVLERERARLRQALDELAAARRQLTESQAEEGAALGQAADVASDLAEEELDLLLEAVERERLGEVEAAIGRLAEGRLGLCERCGDAIVPERLRVLPWARHCVGCASETGPPGPAHLPGALVRR